jgi:microcystin degradation protein MlrC
MATIAVAGFMHETNTFAPIKAGWEDFLRHESSPGLSQGAEILERFPGRNVGIGGFIEEIKRLGHDVVPIAWAAAVPSAHVTVEAFENMSEIILAGLKGAVSFDAVYLDLHGAMVSEHLEDAEGELIRRVRAEVGPDMAIVVSLDLHSNTTDMMVSECDGLIAYRTYPHLDRADTGVRSAGYLDQMLGAAKRPAKARRALPFLMPLTGQCTMVDPTKGVYAFLEEIERRPGVAHVSFTPGFPPADIHDCGPVVVAYGDDQAAADEAADQLYAYIMERESAFSVPFLDPDAAVRQAMAAPDGQLMVLADVQDNSGAGATSDTTGLLAALVQNQAERAVIGALVDPAAAAAAHAAGMGAEIDLAVGGKLFTEGDPPFEGRFTVTGLSDGRFICRGPFYGGSEANLGPCAVLTIGGVSVLISTNRMQAADKDIFRHIGVEPTEQKILGLKSAVHFRGDFTDIADDILVVFAPGAFIDQPEKLPFENLRPGVRLCPNGPVSD